MMMDFLNNNAGFCLAENLRALRKRMKWSQEELADKVGLNRGNIASYENGTAEPKICNLVKLAHLFNLSVFDLTHANLKEDEAYTQAILQHQNGSRISNMPAIGHFFKEAEDFQQAVKGLHCLFRLKVKNVSELPEDMQFLTEQFEQLYGVTDQLLRSHLELIALIKEKCTETNSHHSPVKTT
jgi:transcriptional regulator with XRE-family HTH domain